jgi:hypothetical protein
VFGLGERLDELGLDGSDRFRQASVSSFSFF